MGEAGRKTTKTARVAETIGIKVNQLTCLVRSTFLFNFIVFIHSLVYLDI